jgi:hypothetical protein
MIVAIESADASPLCPCGCGDVLTVACFGDDGTLYDWRMSEPDLARYEALYSGVTRTTRPATEPRTP